MADNFHESAHPLIKHKLTHLRRHEGDVPSRQFHDLMREMGRLLGYEVTRDFTLSERQTPFKAQNGGTIPARTLGPRKPVIVPILRGGLVLAEGLRDVIPTTYTGHIGMSYDVTQQGSPHVYLIALPEDVSDRTFILVDPVVASGVTACHAIDILLSFRITPANIRFVSVVVSAEGKRLLRERHEQVHVYCAAVDEKLDGPMVIPGMGSVSTRLYRTVV
jgi:uracil phosphoribosyltransferase